MKTPDLHQTARELVAPLKGILAADESTSTIAKRLQSIGVANSEDARRAYRELLFTTDGAEEYVSGVILYDETIRQKSASGRPFVEVLQSRGIMPGIKVDTGAHALAGCPGEKITEGLDGLRDRIVEYRKLGARFAKWRAVIAIGDGLPSDTCLHTNAHALARYAAICQENGLVPIVEPEVLMEGSHDIETCFAVTSRTLHCVFDELERQRVDFEGMLLKPNMVISGQDCPKQAPVPEVAARTVACLRRYVPAAVPGIVFLSGGQSDEKATAHLDAMNRLDESRPWELSFSYGRALQAPALATWAGKPDRVAAASAAYLHRARLNSAARNGRYDAAMER